MSEEVYKPTVAKNDPKWISVVGSSRRYNRNKILAVLLIVLAMSLIQVSSVNVALSSIGHATGATSAEIQWVLAGYALAIGIALVPSGRLGDIFGRAELFMIGLAAFTLASTACGLVSDALWLNILRIVQGLAAGVFSPQVTGIIQQYFSGQARAKAFSLFGFVISVSVALGPVLTGLLITWFGGDLGWRSSFLINLPLGLIGLIAGAFWLPFNAEGKRRKAGKGSHLVAKMDLDPVGMVTLIFAVLCIMLPFASHGSAWRWVLLPIAVVLGVGFVWWENRYAKRGKQPMVDLRLFKLTSFSYNVAVGLLQFLGITSVFALVAIYVQQGLFMSAMIAGLIGLPNALTSAVASLWSGKYAIVRGRGLQVFAVCMMLLGVLIAGCCALLVPKGYSPWFMSIGFAVQGIGQGMMSSVNQTQAMLDVPPALGGVAGGVTQTVQRIATAIGNTITTGVLFAIVGTQSSVEAWSKALFASYLIIAIIMGLCVCVAVAYWRVGRKDTSVRRFGSAQRG